MTSITNTSAYFSNAGTIGKQNATGGTLDSASQIDKSKVDDREKKMEDAKQVLAQLSTIKQDMTQSRKASAAERIARIKVQIKMLKMMGGNPKAIARQIAQLAGELASAVREYSSGSGDGATLPDVASGGSQISGANESAKTSATVSTSILSSDTATLSSAGNKSISSAKDAVSSASPDATPTETPKQREEAAQQKLKDVIEKKTSEIAQQSSEAQAKKEFIDEVRSLAAQLKTLAEQQKKRMHQIGNQSSNQDFEKIDQSLASIDTSLSSISTGNIAVNATISTFA